jgi:NADH-quinone oxidoreductase subunit L
LFFRKWFFDEIYHSVFVKNAQKLGQFFWVRGDQKTIDAFGPNGFAFLSQRMSGLLGRFQSGFVFQYAFVMIVGVVALLTWFAWRMDLFASLFVGM